MSDGEGRQNQYQLFGLILALFVLVVLAVISLFITIDFIVPLIFTLLLVPILEPFYKKVKKVFRFHGVTALIVIFTFMLIFLIPISVNVFQITKELNTLNITQLSEKVGGLENYLSEKVGFQVPLTSQLGSMATAFKKFFSSTLLRIPYYIFNIFIIIFFYYYFSKEKAREFEFFKSVIGKERYYKISRKIRKLIFGIFYGQILVRFLQALVGTLGFVLIGIESAFLWGLLIFFAAFVPLVGTGLIWVPLILIYVARENYVVAFAVFIVGVVISFVDNLLIPYFVSEKTKMGPVVILISIIGGLELFGLYGTLLGPFFLGTLFISLEEFFTELRKYNPNWRRFIWTQKEREEFRKLKNEEERAEFIARLNEKYERKEMEGEEVAKKS